jgi:predicted nuclease of restriction endonuclease-like (RecB) superfamily
MQSSFKKTAEYKNWVLKLKIQFNSARIKSAIKVNTDLLNFYWFLGKEICEKEATSNWGDGIIEQVSNDLSAEFPDVKGFSRTNLFYIRKWFLFYQQPEQMLQISSELFAGSTSGEIIPQLVGQIPWGHNREIITKCSTVQEALYYVHETIRQNWSRSMLILQIEGKLYQRQGKAIHNFQATLPAPQADLARETLKNPYNFDFLSLGIEAQERDLETALTDHIQKFLLELGQGFAYMGRQYHVTAGGKDYYLDLLFYHTRLRCFIIVELKVKEFEPEFIGKLNFLLNVVDDKLKHQHDQPSIGILLCKTPVKVIVEYALKNVMNPLGVAEYQILNSIPENLKGELPTIEELENELKME